MSLENTSLQSGQLLVRVTDTTRLYKKTKIHAYFVKWTFKNSHISSKDSSAVYDAPVTITGVEGMPEPANQLIAYPNPTKDYAILFTPLVPSEEGNVTVFDAQGKKLDIAQELTVDGFYSINFGKQPSGTYFIVFETASGKFRTKLIKQ